MNSSDAWLDTSASRVQCKRKHFFDASWARKLNKTSGESLSDFEPSSQSTPLSIIDDRGVFDTIREIKRLFLKLYHRIPSSVDVLGAHNLIQSFEIFSWNFGCLKWKVWGVCSSMNSRDAWLDTSALSVSIVYSRKFPS